MGNKCGRSALGRQRICLMEDHTLSEEQVAELEKMFKRAANGKRGIGFKEFLGLYPEDAKFQRDESDMRSVFYAFADTQTNTLKFDGFAILMMLSKRVGCVAESAIMQALFQVMDQSGCKSIAKADFDRFVRSLGPEEEISTLPMDQTDITDGAESDDVLIGFDEFSEFCGTRNDTYEAICSYVFPMWKCRCD